jgi:hypothetical protein
MAQLRRGWVDTGTADLESAIFENKVDCEERGSETQEWLSYEECTVDALASRADEGRGQAAIRSGEPLAGFDPEISEIGKPGRGHALPPRKRRERGELKHLSTHRKRKKPRIP